MTFVASMHIATLPQPRNPCAPIVNPIAYENSNPGAPQRQSGINGAAPREFRGFATDISVDRSQLPPRHARSSSRQTNARAYRLDIHRMGCWIDVALTT